MSNAITDVLAERARQRSGEGWTDAHDDAHTDRSLAAVALCYVGQYYGRSWLFRFDEANEYANDPPPDYWPESWDDEWWKPKNPRSDLVRAAALLLAEIERLDRLAAAQKKEEGQ